MLIMLGVKIESLFDSTLTKFVFPISLSGFIGKILQSVTVMFAISVIPFPIMSPLTKTIFSLLFT